MAGQARHAMPAAERDHGREAPRRAAQSGKAAGKRDAIIRAATQVINARSYAQATMTEIAATLNLRDATLYYYFPSKQALAYACHRRTLETFEQLLAEADALDASGAAKLEHFLRAMLDDADRRGAQLYIGDYSYLEPAQRDEVGQWLVRLTGRGEAFLKQGIADGSIAPCETALVAQLLVGSLIWLAKWAPTMECMSVDRLMAAITAFTLDGLRRR